MKKTTILIIEDEVTVAGELAGKLRQLGYEVAGIVAGGRIALETADRVRPHLVIMDIRLEGTVDGIEAVEEIRNRIDVPVIYLTARSDPATLDRLKASGSFGYISQPFEERELAKQIELALHKHQADRQIRQQKELLRVTLSSIGDAVISTDADGRISFINPMAESLTGWPAGEAIGLPVSRVFRVIDEETGESLENHMDLAWREGRTVPPVSQAALVTRDGRIVPIEDNSSPILDAAGQLIGAVLVFHDVTTKRRTEETLRENEQRYRGLFEAMSEGFALHEIIVDNDGKPCDYRFLEANSAFEKQTGIKMSELLGRTFRQLLPDGEDFWITKYGQVALTGKPAHFEHWSRTLGRCYEVSAFQTGPGRFATLFLDITDRKVVEEEIRRGEERFKLLSDTAGRLLASENPQGLVNELCRKVMEHLDCHAFFNFLLDEDTGRLRLNAYAGIPVEEALKIEWLDLGVAVCGCAAQEGCRIVAEDIFHTPDVRTDLVKSYGIQAYACHPLMIGDKVIGTLSFGTRTRSRFSSEDLGLMKTVADQVATAMERRRLIEELRHSRDELEQRVQARTSELERKNQELQEFAYAASHDLQEPLRKVTTFGDRLKKKYGDALEDDGKEYLERMLRATTRMQSLLKHLLDYSRVTTKAEPFRQVNLEETIREVLSDLEVSLEKTGGRVEVGNLPDISADPTQMRQLFQNLIGNGLKFHKAGESPVVKVWGRSNGKRNLRIVIEDNGIGFDQKYRDKIFSPFQRLHGRNEYEGAGMGLAICKKIVERHGGVIRAESTPGEGARFIVTLPGRSAKDKGRKSDEKE